MPLILLLDLDWLPLLYCPNSLLLCGTAQWPLSDHLLVELRYVDFTAVGCDLPGIRLKCFERWLATSLLSARRCGGFKGLIILIVDLRGKELLYGFSRAVQP